MVCQSRPNPSDGGMTVHFELRVGTKEHKMRMNDTVMTGPLRASDPVRPASRGRAALIPLLQAAAAPDR